MSDQDKSSKDTNAAAPARLAQPGEGHVADARHDSGTKNPEGEAENPSPMPRADQGRGRRGQPAKKPDDPEGQQGSTDHNRNH